MIRGTRQNSVSSQMGLTRVGAGQYRNAEGQMFDQNGQALGQTPSKPSYMPQVGQYKEGVPPPNPNAAFNPSFAPQTASSPSYMPQVGNYSGLVGALRGDVAKSQVMPGDYQSQSQPMPHSFNDIVDGQGRPGVRPVQGNLARGLGQQITSGVANGVGAIGTAFNPLRRY